MLSYLGVPLIGFPVDFSHFGCYSSIGSRFLFRLLIILLYYCSLLPTDTYPLWLLVFDIERSSAKFDLFVWIYFWSRIFYKVFVGSLCIFWTFSNTLSISDRLKLSFYRFEGILALVSNFWRLFAFKMLFIFETDEKLLTALPLSIIGCD
jgi:hypothetical protein